MFTADKIERCCFDSKSGAEELPYGDQANHENVKAGHRTEVTYTSVLYNVGLQDNIFTERDLGNLERWMAKSFASGRHLHHPGNFSPASWEIHLSPSPSFP